MTVRDFFSMFMADSSTIHRLFFLGPGCEYDPVFVSHDFLDYIDDVLLDANISRFLISCVDLFIFLK